MEIELWLETFRKETNHYKKGFQLISGQLKTERSQVSFCV